MEIQINTLTAEQFLFLYASVGWEPPGKKQVEAALDSTLAAFTAWDGGSPVGMVRLLGDRGMSFYLKDFAVAPAYQAKGVGTRLLQAAESYITSILDPSWAVSLELIASREAAAFYKKHGFEERPCDWDGPGMFKMLRP